MSQKQTTADEVRVGSGTYGYVYRKGKEAYVTKYSNDCDDYGTIFSVYNEFCILNILDHQGITQTTGNLIVDTQHKLNDNPDPRIGIRLNFLKKLCYGTGIIEDLENDPRNERSIAKLWRTLLTFEYIHANGIIHGDVKKQNVMLANYPRNTTDVVVIDFGISKHIHNLYVSAIKCNSPIIPYIYRPPEMYIHGFNETWVDGSCDIWSLAISIVDNLVGINYSDDFQMPPRRFHLLKNTYLFFERSNGEIYASLQPKRDDDPPGFIKPLGMEEIISDLNIISELKDLLSKMLTYNPEDRPSVRKCMMHPVFTKYILPPPIDSATQFLRRDVVKKLNLAQLKKHKRMRYRIMRELWELSKGVLEINEDGNTIHQDTRYLFLFQTISLLDQYLSQPDSTFVTLPAQSFWDFCLFINFRANEFDKDGVYINAVHRYEIFFRSGINFLYTYPMSYIYQYSRDDVADELFRMMLNPNVYKNRTSAQIATEVMRRINYNS